MKVKQPALHVSRFSFYFSSSDSLLTPSPDRQVAVGGKCVEGGSNDTRQAQGWLGTGLGAMPGFELQLHHLVVG